MTTQIYNTIYKVDSKGKVRVWYAEREDDKYRMWDGTKDGKVKCSEWRVALPTNVGRANERLGPAQAEFEIRAVYKKKLEKDYHERLEEAGAGAHIFEVMLAEKYMDRVENKKTGEVKIKNQFSPGYAQPKLDGFRCIPDKNGLWSRSGKPFLSCPHISEILEPLFANANDLRLDGELYNHELKEDFNELQSLITEKKPSEEHFAKTRELVQLHVYDLPTHPGTFSERIKTLKDMVASLGDQNHVVFVETTKVDTEEQFDSDHNNWLMLGYEGSIWRADTVYENRRTKNLLKRKEFEDMEFDVVAIQEGQGNWAGAAKRVVCWLPGADRSNGPDWENRTNIFEAGIRGTRERNRQLLHEEHAVVTVRFFGWTPSEIPKPRFGVATKWHGQKRET